MGIFARKMFKIEVHGIGISGILRANQRVITHHFLFWIEGVRPNPLHPHLIHPRNTHKMNIQIVYVYWQFTLIGQFRYIKILTWLQGLEE